MSNVHCSSFIATSLDGYIARPDGGLDWLDRANETVTPGEDCGYAEYIQSVQAIAMGRSTFEKVCTFPEWPYGNMPVYLLSTTLKILPEGLPASVQIHAGPPQALLAHAAAQGHQRFYVDGGRTVQSFLAAGLLNEISITTIPVLLGEGLPLFGPMARDIQLRHLATRTFPFGFVQSRYAVQHNATAG